MRQFKIYATLYVFWGDAIAFIRFSKRSVTLKSLNNESKVLRGSFGLNVSTKFLKEQKGD